MKLNLSNAGRKRARIQIIPLIDIMFFLLATFVMVSTSMIKNKGISVNLPTAETGQKETRKNNYASLSVSKDGEYFLDKTKIDIEDLSAKLLELKASDAGFKVFINGDKDANVSSLVGALDIVRKSGISKVALETK